MAVRVQYNQLAHMIKVVMEFLSIYTTPCKFNLDHFVCLKIGWIEVVADSILEICICYMQSPSVSRIELPVEQTIAISRKSNVIKKAAAKLK